MFNCWSDCYVENSEETSFTHFNFRIRSVTEVTLYFTLPVRSYSTKKWLLDSLTELFSATNVFRLFKRLKSSAGSSVESGTMVMSWSYKKWGLFDSSNFRADDPSILSLLPSVRRPKHFRWSGYTSSSTSINDLFRSTNVKLCVESWSSASSLTQVTATSVLCFTISSVKDFYWEVSTSLDLWTF